MSICKWKPSPIFPNEYKVSENGDVLSVRNNKLLRPALDKNGYKYYVLCVNGRRVTVKAHRLVAIAFIPNVQQKPTVDHINGVKTDNRVSNLRWATNKENTNNPITLHRVIDSVTKRLPIMYEYAKKNNFNRKPVIVKWDDGREEMYPSLKATSEATGKNYSKLSEIINGKRKQPKTFNVSWAKEQHG